MFQDLLRDTFTHFKISIEKSFTRNEGGEQIDGAFIFNSWHYIVECRWREKIADERQVDGLLTQVLRSGGQSMGIFISINGWSKNVPNLLKQNPKKVIILIDGEDLLSVLKGEISLQKLLEGKVANLNLKSEPFIGAEDIIKQDNI